MKRENIGVDFISAQRGITLVGLVITIIILIILATVSIKVVFDDAMVKKAKVAAQNYLNAQKWELDEFDRLLNRLGEWRTRGKCRRKSSSRCIYSGRVTMLFR